MNREINKEDLKKYGREVKIWERLNLMFMILVFWFLCKIRISWVNPKLGHLLGGVGKLKFEFPENVKEILKSKMVHG